MQVVYHVLAVDEPSQQVAATITPIGWLLPTVLDADDVAPARLVLRIEAMLASRVRLRCITGLRVAPQAGAADATVLVDLVDPPRDDDPGLVGIATLVDGRGLLAYQANLPRLVRHGAGTEHEGSPFMQSRWIGDVAGWIAAVTGHDAGSLIGRAQIHRAEAEGAVVSFRAGAELLHFKGSTRAPFTEALVTQAIERRLPALVAPTIAFDRGRGWWLTRHVEGLPIETRHWPAHLIAANEWARLQLATAEETAALIATAGVPRLDATTLYTAAVAALDVVDIASSTVSIAHVQAAVTARLSGPLVRNVPLLALHFDAAPRNVLWNGDRAVFLDLEALAVGPGAVAGELMRRRMALALSPAAGRRLAVRAAAAVFRAIRRPDLIGQLDGLSALTDLCLLALRRHQLFGPHAASLDEATRRYTWRCLAADFVSRASR